VVDEYHPPACAPGTSKYLSESCLSTEEIRTLYEEVKQLSAERSDVGRLSIADRDIDALAKKN